MKVSLIINYVCSVWITDLSCQMESAVTAPVSGHVKRVVVQEGMRYFVMIVSSLLTFFAQAIRSTRATWLWRSCISLRVLNKWIICCRPSFYSLYNVHIRHKLQLPKLWNSCTNHACGSFETSTWLYVYVSFEEDYLVVRPWDDEIEMVFLDTTSDTSDTVHNEWNYSLCESYSTTESKVRHTLMSADR